MKGKVLFYFNGPLCDKVWRKAPQQGKKTINDFVESAPVASGSCWGNELFRKELRYEHQMVADARGDVSGKELLMTTGYVLEDNQRLEYYSTDGEYDLYPYCEQRHFAKGNLSGAFSGVKFRGRFEDVLQAYDGIMEIFGSLRVHMISISCTKSYDGLTAEIQLEYDDYIVEKAYFAEIANRYPDLRMLAISMPEGKWENWFFFTSGSYSTSVKVEEVRYERTADPDYYWAKSTYFDEDDWLLGDFIFVERERRTDVYPNLFNWSETLEYPSHYWGTKSLRFCAVQTRHAKKIILPNVARYIIGGSFSNCTNLKEIAMPSVTQINRDAFFKCKALKKLVVSEKLVSIDDKAFVDCGNFKVDAPTGSYAEKYFGAESEFADPDFVVKDSVLVKYTGKGPTVVIPEGVREIGESVFYDNQRIHEAILPGSVEILRRGAFYRCTNLERVILPEGLKTISDDAFSQCAQLKEIILPRSVNHIGDYAFYGCKNLTAITIPEGVTTISDSAFAECKNLQEVILPESITTIEKQAFGWCKSLTTINIPQNLTSIGDAAFMGCGALTEIDIPASIAKIGFSAFAECKKLARVTLHGDDIAFGSGAFSGCRKLADKKKMVIVANILFDYFGKEEHVIVPDGIIALGDKVFSSCFDTTSITLPESVIAIGPHSFPLCIELKAPVGSYAEKYADDFDIKFTAIEKQLPEQPNVIALKNSADVAGTDTLEGKTFVVTGDLFHYANRDALKEIIEAKGGKLTGSVSAKTTALITNFPDSGTTKIKKAKELGVEIITEDEFIEYYLTF